jgi:integrase
MRANGLTWIYRFQTTRPSDGARVENTRTIGLVKDIGASATVAWKEVGRLGLHMNLSQAPGDEFVFRDLAEHFRERELKKRSGIAVKAGETANTSEGLLNRWILPRWGDKRPSEIKSLDIEEWFEALASIPQGVRNKPLSWPSITKIRSVMSQVFKHAQRHELIPAAIDKKGKATNPALLARTESGSDYEAVVVSPDQMIVILNELDSPDTRLEWTLALLHGATGLRPEEAFGLKWEDIDWDCEQIHVRRGWSKGKETAGKTKASMTQVAMHPALAGALEAWRRESVYGDDSDWVFASRTTKGKTPRSAGVAAQDYLRPAAVRAGVISENYRGRFGWHNLRHSLGTFLADNEVNLSLIQQMLRHTRPSTSALYIHRVNKTQIAAQGKYLDAINIASEVA